MLTENLFQKIIDRQIPADIVYEDDRCLAFRDINPQAPTHVVVVPRAHHDDAYSLAQVDPALVGAVVATAGAVAEQEGITESGYRLVFNTGVGAGQTVLHAHCHVLGGRPMTWPPG